MPVDQILKEYHVRLYRTTEIDAPVEIVLAALATVDLRQSRLLRLLSPSSRTARRWSDGLSSGDQQPLRFVDLRGHDLTVLANEPGQGIALGAIARLWSVRPSLQRVSPEYFLTTQRPGLVKITATFDAEPIADARSRLVSEIRFLPLDLVAHRHFRMGWPYGRILTGLVQREVLSLIARHARDRRG